MSVCLFRRSSRYLSRSGVVSKRLDLSSEFFHHAVVRHPSLFRTKPYSEILTKSSQIEALPGNFAIYCILLNFSLFDVDPRLSIGTRYGPHLYHNVFFRSESVSDARHYNMSNAAELFKLIRLYKERDTHFSLRWEIIL